jgi:hypothetical protein
MLEGNPLPSFRGGGSRTRNPGAGAARSTHFESAYGASWIPDRRFAPSGMTAVRIKSNMQAIHGLSKTHLPLLGQNRADNPTASEGGRNS